MAKFEDRVKAVANALIATVSMTTAVAVTDITSAATKLHGEYGDYSANHIRTKIADEIKKTHRPGISGSL